MANQRSEISLKKLIFLQTILLLVSMQTTPLVATNVQNPPINNLPLDDPKLSPVKLTQPSLISSVKTMNVSVNNTVQPIETINVQNEQLKPIRMIDSPSSSDTTTTKTIQTNDTEIIQGSYGQPYGKLSLQDLVHIFAYNLQPLTLKTISNVSETMTKAVNNGNIMMNNSQESAFNKVMTKNALKLTKDLLDSAESQTLPTRSSNTNTTTNNGVSQQPQSNHSRPAQTSLSSTAITNNNNTVNSTIKDTSSQPTHVL